MTLAEAIEAVREAGAHLVLDDQGPLLRGRVPADVVAVLRANRDRVAALLRLRELHRGMGLDAEDTLLVERAILSGQIENVLLVVKTPALPA